MRNPIDNWLSTYAQLGACVCLLLATLVYASFLKKQGAPLSSVLRYGIVSLEVPWSSEAAKKMVIDIKGANLQNVADRQIKLDFPFLVIYPLTLSLACFLLSGVSPDGLHIYGLLIGWAVLLCAPLDAVENVGMLVMLHQTTSPPWPQLTTIAAAIKFSVLFGALFYVVVAISAAVIQYCRAGYR